MLKSAKDKLDRCLDILVEKAFGAAATPDGKYAAEQTIRDMQRTLTIDQIAQDSFKSAQNHYDAFMLYHEEQKQDLDKQYEQAHNDVVLAAQERDASTHYDAVTRQHNVMAMRNSLNMELFEHRMEFTQAQQRIDETGATTYLVFNDAAASAALYAKDQGIDTQNLSFTIEETTSLTSRQMSDYPEAGQISQLTGKYETGLILTELKERHPEAYDQFGFE